MQRYWIRVRADQVEAAGDLQRLRLKVTGQPPLVLKSKRGSARIAGGFLEYED